MLAAFGKEFDHDPNLEAQDVSQLLAEPDLAGDPAGGLETKLPPKAFLR
jgi:hypothetical protein